MEAQQNQISNKTIENRAASSRTFNYFLDKHSTNNLAQVYHVIDECCLQSILLFNQKILICRFVIIIKYI